jgi:hypothetical protein
MVFQLPASVQYVTGSFNSPHLVSVFWSVSIEIIFGLDLIKNGKNSPRKRRSEPER